MPYAHKRFEKNAPSSQKKTKIIHVGSLMPRTVYRSSLQIDPIHDISGEKQQRYERKKEIEKNEKESKGKKARARQTKRQRESKADKETKRENAKETQKAHLLSRETISKKGH